MVCLKEKSCQGPLHWLHNSCDNVISLLSHVLCGSQLFWCSKGRKVNSFSLYIMVSLFIFTSYCCIYYHGWLEIETIILVTMATNHYLWFFIFRSIDGLHYCWVVLVANPTQVCAWLGDTDMRQQLLPECSKGRVFCCSYIGCSAGCFVLIPDGLHMCCFTKNVLWNPSVKIYFTG